MKKTRFSHELHQKGNFIPTSDEHSKNSTPLGLYIMPTYGKCMDCLQRLLRASSPLRYTCERWRASDLTWRGLVKRHQESEPALISVFSLFHFCFALSLESRLRRSISRSRLRCARLCFNVSLHTQKTKEDLSFTGNYFELDGNWQRNCLW